MSSFASRLRLLSKRIRMPKKEKSPPNIPSHPVYRPPPVVFHATNLAKPTPLHMISFIKPPSPGLSCVFCHQEMNGDIMIKLTCDHFAHKSCLSLMFDTDDQTKLPVCGVCQQVTRCMDDNLHDHMVEELDDNVISLPPFAVI